MNEEPGASRDATVIRAVRSVSVASVTVINDTQNNNLTRSPHRQSELDDGDRTENSDQFPQVDLNELDTAVPAVKVGAVARRTPAEFTRRNSKGEYPLHVALQTPNRSNKVINMIERGHPLEVEDYAGWTPLGEATGNKNIEYLRILVEAGADINHRNNLGETALHFACRAGWLVGVDYLIDRGATIVFRTDSGHTALGYIKNHFKEGSKRNCHKDYKLPGIMEKLESLIRRMENMYKNLGLSVNVDITDDEDGNDNSQVPRLQDVSAPPVSTPSSEIPAESSSEPQRRVTLPSISETPADSSSEPQTTNENAPRKRRKSKSKYQKQAENRIKKEERKQLYAAAIEDLKNDNYTSLRSCARAYGLNHSMLSRMINHGAQFGSQGKKLTEFTWPEEVRIAEHITEMLRLGFGLTIAELLPLFQEAMTSLLEADKNRTTTWVNNMPPYCFVWNYTQRHNLVLRSSMEITKARSVITPESLKLWQRDTEIGKFVNHTLDHDIF